MTVVTPTPTPTERATAPGRARADVLARVNPVAKLLAALVLSLALVLTIDWVSASVALGLELLALPLLGVPFRRLALRMLPLVVAAPLTGLTIVLYGAPSGTSYFRFALIEVTDGSIALGLATALRVLAIGLPAVVLFLTVDPTDLADGLAQVLRLPSRFVLGALAGFRLVGLFAADWRALGLARRARGLADSGRVRRFFGQAFSLLVISIRRGSKLAVAMEARGFGSDVQRTWARESRFGRAEAVTIAAGALIGAIAVSASILAGTWNFVVG